jgi:hypothetical protein
MSLNYISSAEQRKDIAVRALLIGRIQSSGDTLELSDTEIDMVLDAAAQYPPVSPHVFHQLSKLTKVDISPSKEINHE